MVAVPFDTLDFIRRLKAGGFTPEQAETMADALKGSAMTELATKQVLRTEIRELEHRMTARLGAMMAAVAGLLFAALKLIH